VERVGVGGVVAAGASLTIDNRATGLFDGELRLGLGGWQRAAAGESGGEAEGAGQEGTGS